MIEINVSEDPNNNMVPGSDIGLGATLRNMAKALPVVKSSNVVVRIGICNIFFILFFFLYAVEKIYLMAVLQEWDLVVSCKENLTSCCELANL